MTYTDESVFADVPFTYSHKLTLDRAKAADDASRLKAEIEAAKVKEIDARAATTVQSAALATALALK